MSEKRSIRDRIRIAARFTREVKSLVGVYPLKVRKCGMTRIQEEWIRYKMKILRGGE